MNPVSRQSLLLALTVTAACDRSNVEVEPGVSLELAERRASLIADINYRLALTIPEKQGEDIKGTIAISLTLADDGERLQLDFREDADHLHEIVVNGETVPVDFRGEHVLIPPDRLRTGSNLIEIGFTAGSTSLNRNPEYLYTLFVPDRARTAFPLFDQPDLKATYELTLQVPAGWTAISNAPVASVEDQQIRFERSDLISSYLFSFVAGKFDTVVRDVGGRQMTMLHRETDAEKVARNLDEIFDLHGAALDWLEEYTGIDYPYKKFGFVLIPAHPYGGMEHVGAIQYRASMLFLEEAPSDTLLLRRATLIAHEVAHMWFGNLVTMQWFNDVWTKEVFANLMAGKVVNPSFPNINHELNFLVRHYPAAYSVDRTSGANPIRQRLPNLDEAGQMYGAMIYNKAPIMMRELELMIGEALFREGVQEYLETYSFGNATWPGLIEILDRKTDEDLAAWSDGWVNKSGRPEYDEPDDAMAYGLFPPQAGELDNWQTLDEISRASLLINTYENLLSNRTMAPAAYLDRILGFVEQETNALILDLLLDQIRQTYWLLLDDGTRAGKAPLVEGVLWDAMLARAEASERKTLFLAFVDIALTPRALARAQQVWAGDQEVNDLPLGEDDRIGIAQELAVKLAAEAENIIDAQVARTDNPDSLRMLEFIRPSLSPRREIRDRFFESLANESNRESEQWVFEALKNLHHPLRTRESERYIVPSLKLLEEIQVTGDIFFPKAWLDATLGNYRSESAVTSVRSFLEERPNYNEQLRMKILQSADMMFRANVITSVADQGER
jgi:aminopeptidase N